MKYLTGTMLMSGISLLVVGCTPAPDKFPELQLTTVSRSLDADLELPQVEPQFNALDFSLAEYDRELGRFYIIRPLFRFEDGVREEQRTIMQEVEVTREQVDPDGTTRTVVEREEIPEVRTREVSYTEFVWLYDQILSCPISAVLIFDSQGQQLSEAQVEAAFAQERRVVIQNHGSNSQAYYRAFLHPDVLFVQSQQWMEENVPDSSVGDDKDAAVAPPAPVIKN